MGLDICIIDCEFPTLTGLSSVEIGEGGKAWEHWRQTSLTTLFPFGRTSCEKCQRRNSTP